MQSILAENQPYEGNRKNAASTATFITSITGVSSPGAEVSTKLACKFSGSLLHGVNLRVFLFGHHKSRRRPHSSRRAVRFRLCMSMEWMNECVDWLFITQLLKACLSTVRVS
jgi:hypothetical protein